MPSILDLITLLGTKHYINFILFSLCLYIILESLFPLYKSRGKLVSRWWVNFSLLIIGISILSILLFILGYDKKYAADLNIGLFKQIIDVPLWLQFVIFLLFADACFYGLHRLSHHWRPLWRLHLVHHTDLDIDSTTTFRGHFIGYFISFLLMTILLIVLGVPVWTIMAFQLIHSFHAIFSHCNVQISPFFDKILRLVIVTPDMHRVHHGADKQYTNSNYGMIFSFWDRLFDSYQFLDREQQIDMSIGLEYYRESKEQSLWASLKHPFTYKP